MKIDEYKEQYVYNFLYLLSEKKSCATNVSNYDAFLLLLLYHLNLKKGVMCSKNGCFVVVPSINRFMGNDYGFVVMYPL